MVGPDSPWRCVDIFADPGRPITERHPAFEQFLQTRGLIRGSDATPTEHVFGIARALVPRGQALFDAEDVLYRVLALCFFLAHTLKKKESLGSWLFGITRIVVLRMIEKDKPFKTTAEMPAESAAPVTDCAGTSEIETQEFYQQAIDVIMDLPEDQRIVVLLHVFEDMNLAEVARHLQVPAATIRQRWHRARITLRDKLSR